MDLRGKRAVVTGGSKGIGLAIGRALAGSGCRVVLAARNQESVEKAAGELAGSSGSEVIGLSCDVGRAPEVERLIEEVSTRFGGLEILINNAGVGIFETVEKLSVSQWDRLIGTNLNSVFYACHFALPLMKQAGEGFIINISSLAGKNAFPKGAAYNASKFALTGFSEALMQEVRHDNIRVAYVMPGSVETHFGGRSPSQESWRLSSEDVAEVVLHTLTHHPRCLTSRIEMRPSRPPK